MTPNCHTFLKTKLQNSVTIWEHLSKRSYFWTITKLKKRGKSVTIWDHGVFFVRDMLYYTTYIILWDKTPPAAYAERVEVFIY